MQLSVLFFNFNARSVLVDEIKQHFAQHEDILLASSNMPLEASAHLQDHAHTVFIFVSSNEQELSQIKLLLKRFDQSIRKNNIRPIAILNKALENEEASLKSLGCQHIFNFQISSEQLIDIIENVEDALILEDPELADLAEDLEGIMGSSQTKTEQEKNDEVAVISSVTEVTKDEQIQLEKSSLGDISLESGTLSMQMASDDNGIEPNSELRIEHFEAQELEFQVKSELSHQLSIGDKVDVQVAFVYDRCKVEILVDGIITEMEHTETDSSLVSVQLSQDESQKLEQFMALYQKRQTQIHEFMELAKDGILYSPSKKREE